MPRPTSDASRKPRRVVLHPRTAAARQHDRARSFGGHVRGYTVDTEDVLALMRSQRRGALGVFMVVFAPALVLPVVFVLWPELAAWRPAGLPPMAWLLLGPLALFGVVALAFVHDRQASIREDRWARGRAEPES